MQKEFNQSYDKVYINCLEAANQLNYNIKKESMSEGLITFKIKMSFWSWGEIFTIKVTKSNNLNTLISVGSVNGQIYDWGKNDQNITEFMALTENLLSK
ncbi:MAG: hypothetical protein V4549_10005 [Bacteroidota bacterium]